MSTQEVSTFQAPEIGCVPLSNQLVWGSRQIWPGIHSLQRLLLTDKQTPALFGELVHQTIAQRSNVLVEALKTCMQTNSSINGVIQEVGSRLKGDRLERLDLIKDGDIPGLTRGQDVITRVVEESVSRPRG